MIDVTSGASRTERLTERDFVGRGPFPLSFERTYDSSELQRASGSAGSLGTRWWHGFERALVHYRSGTADYALLYRPAEGVFSFREDAGTWRAIADAPGRLERIPVAGTSGWRYTAGHEGIEIYESTGRLLSVARAGVTQTLTYSNGDATRYPATAPACKPPAGSSTPTKGRLWCVTDSLGLQLNFAYDLRSLLTKLVSPRGTEVSYAYDAGLLTSVTSKTVAGARMRIYQYPDPPCPGKPSGRAAAGSTC